MKSKLIIFILIVIGFIAAIAVYFQCEKKNNVSFEIPETQNIVKQTSQIDQGEIANWKTYRNEQYGFEIKYPDAGENRIYLTEYSEHSVDSNNPYQFKLSISYMASDDPRRGSDAGIYSNMNLWIYSDDYFPSQLKASREGMIESCEEEVSFYESYCPVGEKQRIFNNLKFIEINSMDNFFGGTVKSYLFSDNNHFFKFINVSGNSSFEKIIETFNIIKHPTWKTNNYEKIGYQFQYPTDYKQINPYFYESYRDGKSFHVYLAPNLRKIKEIYSNEKYDITNIIGRTDSGLDIYLAQNIINGASHVINFFIKENNSDNDRVIEFIFYNNTDNNEINSILKSINFKTCKEYNETIFGTTCMSYQ